MNTCWHYFQGTILTELAPWLPMSPWEILATFFGLWSVWAYARERMSAWPTGLMNVLMYIVLFINIGLYAETGLQVVFTVLQIYGWWRWAQRSGPQRAELTITRTSLRLWLLLTTITTACFVPLGLALQTWTNSTVPWWDSLPTALSLTAQWMISHKKLECWLLWIAVDLISIPLFASKGLYLTAGLYGVFLILCCIGLHAWLRTYRTYRSRAAA